MKLLSSQHTRLAVFASYDKYNIVNDYVIYYLKELNKVADIVFVADNTLGKTELEKIRPLILHLITEKHGGYDFGSYKRGYFWAERNGLLDNYEQLIFCNDSVFGPFHPLKPIFSEMGKNGKADFWGIFMVDTSNKVECNIRDKIHAQSYFIVFNRNVATSKKLKDFMNNIVKLKNKNDIVKEYEIGLSQTLIHEGFRCASYMSSLDNDPHRKSALKIIQKGFPFLKKSLFSAASLNKKAWCYNLWRYKSVISEITPSYPVHSIEDYLSKYLGKKQLRKQLFKLRFRIPPISRFLFYKKMTKKGYLIVKILSFPVYRSKIDPI